MTEAPFVTFDLYAFDQTKNPEQGSIWVFKTIETLLKSYLRLAPRDFLALGVFTSGSFTFLSALILLGVAFNP